MSLEGIVKNGVIVLENGQPLPEGTRVEVAVQLTQPLYQTLLDLAGTVPDLPTDMALNHDHYLYGAPKK